MAKFPEIFYTSCLNKPPWVDDMMRRVREEQERRYLQEMCGMPVYKVSTETFDIDYFRQPWITYDNYIKPNCIVKIEKENNKMEAKKCDRCGKLYEMPCAWENGNGTDVIFKYRRVPNAEDKSGAAIAKEQTRSIYVKGGFSNNDYVDFCPECRISLKKWFENTEKEKLKNEQRNTKG